MLLSGPRELRQPRESCLPINGKAFTELTVTDDGAERVVSRDGRQTGTQQGGEVRGGRVNSATVILKQQQ